MSEVRLEHLHLIYMEVVGWVEVRLNNTKRHSSKAHLGVFSCSAATHSKAVLLADAG